MGKKGIKEAPIFFLAGLIVAVVGLLYCAGKYVTRIEMEGWLNQWSQLSIIYGLCLAYFVYKIRSGEDEPEEGDEPDKKS